MKQSRAQQPTQPLVGVDKIRNPQTQQSTPNEPELSLSASEHYRVAGNRLCSMHRYEEAANYYSKAISKNPEVAIFHSNRALCHLKLQQWTQAIQDCRRAIEIESNSLKGHFFLGQALAETGFFDDALKHLQIAHELAKEKKLNFGDDIAYQIRSTKRRRWNKIEEETAQFEEEMQNYLIKLIISDRDAKLKELTKQAPNYNPGDNNWQPTPSSSTLPDPANNPAGPSHRVEEHDDIELNLATQESIIKSKCDNYVEKLESMFNDLKLKRKKRDVPDYLCGKISFEIMHDPVITPSGITYDRQDIEEHLRRVGHFDPITRQPLKGTQLISNLAMKEVVDAYVNDNEWALYY